MDKISICSAAHDKWWSGIWLWLALFFQTQAAKVMWGMDGRIFMWRWHQPGKIKIVHDLIHMFEDLNWYWEVASSTIIQLEEGITWYQDAGALLEIMEFVDTILWKVLGFTWASAGTLFHFTQYSHRETVRNGMQWHYWLHELMILKNAIYCKPFTRTCAEWD
jgi:hypothetical protein